MSNYSKFFLDFMEPFFGGLVKIVKSFFQGLYKMFNLFNYIDVIKDYKNNLTGFGIIILVLNIICILGLFLLLAFLIYKGIKRYIKFRKNLNEKESLIDEIEKLNNSVYKLKATNERLMNMASNENEIQYDENGNIKNKLKEGESRFFKLTKIDEELANYIQKPANNTISLKEFCNSFRNFAASKLHLYYSERMIRLFISAFASNRIIILEGISGTGKTSLAHAFGKMVKNDVVISSVQPSWRDSSELFGYFNEFTKRFNESEFLSYMYEAKYKDDIFVAVLDEMNIARVEYYFAEMLSVLELPSKDEWMIELVSSTWENDPKLLDNGKIKVPDNMWYIGTINNDDSTFMVTDKVYDRAMPIEINEKCATFNAPETEPIKITSKYFESLFQKAYQDYPLSKENENKISLVDEYIINHFRISFGNRILKQLTQFIPVYVACGGEELDAIDYVVAHKILRKFEQLNFSLIKDEIDKFIDFLNRTFGENKMHECINYLQRLKRQ